METVCVSVKLPVTLLRDGGCGTFWGSAQMSGVAAENELPFVS